MNSTEVAIEKIKGDLNSINQKVDMNQQVILDVLEDIKIKLEKIEGNFVSKETINILQDRIKDLERKTANTPIVNKLVFGAVSLILVAVVTALIALVVRGQNL